MKKTILLNILVIFFIMGIVSAVAPLCNENKGSIWTTKSDCGNVSQDVNQYDIGEKVYINGNDFCESNYYWTIQGQPGGASEDPGIVIINGTKLVDSSGSFCFEAYTIQNDDGGVYSVDFDKKNDNYRVNPNIPVVPEFGVYIGILTLVSAVGLFFVVRRK